MDENRFDSIARNLALTTDRRSMVRGAAGGGFLSMLGLMFSRKTLAAAADDKSVTCAWDIEAHGGVGPNQTKSWNGTLTVTVNPDGDIDQGSYILVDGSWNPLLDSHGNPIGFDVVGSSHLRSIDFRTERDGCVELDFTGVNRFHVRTCQGPMSGSFHGPELVDLGGWRTREAQICPACRGMTCPPGERLDSVACVCAPKCPGGYADCGDSVCVPPACPKGTVYDPERCVCGCEPQTCKPTEVWCPVVCKCLPPKPCLELKCPPGYVGELVDEDICICVKEPCRRPPKCAADEILIYDGKTCRCIPIDGCKKQKCDAGHIWDPGTCACKQTCVKTDCPAGSTWNEVNCSCKLDCVKTECPAGSTWSDAACACVPAGCPAVQCPNQNYIVDATTCQCVCPPTFACVAPYTLNANACTCDCVTQTCSGNYKWNPDSCGCICPDLTCAAGTTFNKDACQCDQTPCPVQPCQGNETWNQDKCACVCELQCAPGSTLDPRKCVCNPDNPCATAPPCADGLIQDSKNCQCHCPDGSPICGAGCADQSTNNCGSCGNHCKFGCENGQCIPG